MFEVTKRIAKFGRMEKWVAFFHLVNSDKLNLYNLAVQAFFGVCHFEKVGNVHANIWAILGPPLVCFFLRGVGCKF